MLAPDWIRTPPHKERIVQIKRVIFGLCLLPLLRLIWLGFQDDLSANPIEFIEHSTGFWGLVFLLITLTMTPLRLWFGIAWVVQLRRMLGLFMFFYACLHITTYVWLDFNFVWEDIVDDTFKHPRILVGFLAFILAVPLAITSNNAMVKKLGPRWKQLHRLVYAVAVLVIVHFLWLVKKDLREPLYYAVILCILLGARLWYASRKKALSTH